MDCPHFFHQKYLALAKLRSWPRSMAAEAKRARSWVPIRVICIMGYNMIRIRNNNL